MEIRLAVPADKDAYFEHVMDHFRESNTGGDVIFHPVTDFETWKKDEFTKKLAEDWSRPITELHWERAWVAEENGKLLGHATLQGGRMPNSFHRVTFSIGLIRPARGRGIGRALTQAAIDWAKAQGSIDWIDLYVFTHNKPALALYRAMGFQEVGTTEDLFRVQGTSVSDTHMVKRIQ
jgi:ribosomal protein S18 acetylase RimI-like enzyme